MKKWIKKDDYQELIVIKDGFHFSYNNLVNEIALYYNGSYYIFMYREELYGLIEEFLGNDNNISEQHITRFWFDLYTTGNYDVSSWSNDFNGLKQ